jgi:bifunctional non-homologous end joining protein LigD
VKLNVEVGGQSLTLSNLDKELYPAFTKGEVIDYYVRVAPVLLPHLRDRPATRIRFPNGVGGSSFFEKNAPSHTPAWVRTERLATPGGRQEFLDFVVIDDLPTLVWCANLAALELHVPQWRIGYEPDLLVFDLDPGPPAGLDEACRVALLLRALLAADGLGSYPKTSGRKGLHLYVPWAGGDPSEYARSAAVRLEHDHPGLVLSRMDKRLRTGKVFVDWSQNNPSKTTVAPYSLRAGPAPLVSAPVTWDEVSAGGLPPFTPQDVLDRIDQLGDLLPS